MMGFQFSNRRHLVGAIIALALIVLPFLNTDSGWLAYPLHIIVRLRRRVLSGRTGLF